MKRGKKYIEAAKLIEKGNLYEKADVMQTSRFVVQLYCRTEQVKRFVSLYLRKMQKLKRRKQLEQITWEAMN